MKEKYVNPEVEICRFDTDDVIVTSGSLQDIIKEPNHSFLDEHEAQPFQ